MGALMTMGVRPKEIFLQYMAKGESNSRGRDLNIHIVHLPADGVDEPVIVGPISMLGDSIPVAAGIAMGARMRGRNLVAMAWIGDGATSTGAFHEGLNFAAVQKIPLVVVAEDNKFAYSTPISKQMAITRIDERAAAYGIPHEMVDGNDILAVYDVAKRMVDRARAGEGASLIGIDTMRMQGHAQHDDARYVPKALIEQWAAKDPIARYPPASGRDGHGDREGSRRHRRDDEELRGGGGTAGGGVADARPGDRDARRLRRRRFRGAARGDREVAVQRSEPMAVITYLEAIRQALFDEMARDERVFLLGEDIGVYGGAFKVTDGLHRTLRRARVIDTPISEAAIVGSAIGASYMGMRPGRRDAVHRLHRLLLRHAHELRRDEPLPQRRRRADRRARTVRRRRQRRAVPLAEPRGVLPEHARPEDGGAVDRLRREGAAQGGDPRRRSGALLRAQVSSTAASRTKCPTDDYIVPIGKAAVRREGSDLSIITFGAMVYTALEAAEALAEQGVEAEIIDLRSLAPLDREAVLTTVAKTSRALLLHEATLTGGIGGELAAIITEEAFEYLDAPVMRVASMDAPVPYSPPLEAAFLPSVDKVVAAAKSLVEY